MKNINYVHQGEDYAKYTYERNGNTLGKALKKESFTSAEEKLD